MSTCNTNKKKEKEWLQTYGNSLLEFNPNMIGHFPFDLTPFEKRKLYIYHLGATDYNNKAGIIIDTWSDSLFFYNTMKALNNRNITNYSINDDKLIFIGDTLTDYSNIKNGKPISSFSNIRDQFGLSNIKLNMKEHVYILECEKGEFLEKEDLTTELMLPDEWKHGFSRGIVADSSEFRLTYWLVLW